MMYSQGGSRRWNHFQKALELAVQQSSHKWTFEEFAECFPSVTNEDRNKASTMFTSIADYMEGQISKDLNSLFQDYNTQQSIDILHQIITTAKDRKASGVERKDVWRADLEPHAAVAARVVPVLEKSAAQLREAIAEIKESNAQLAAQLHESIDAGNNVTKESTKILDSLDAATEAWKEVPAEEIQAWTIQTIESTAPVQRG